MKRTGTFAYLPPLTREEISRQVAYILKRGWIPGIEHATEEELDVNYRHWWKLPLFNAKRVDEVMAELDACREAHPHAYILVAGYNPARQHLGIEFVAYFP